MSKRRLVFAVVSLGAFGCATGSKEGKPAAVTADASSYSAYGMTIDRPSQWHFVQPDTTVAPDTQVILHGPIGAAALAPTIEVSRRPLTASDQRRAPAMILTALVNEIAQTFDGFEAQSSPQDVDIGGRKAARMDVTLTESLSDGTEERRAAQLYAIVDGEQLWVVRGFGPGDGSANSDISQVVKGIHF
jgi:hypothetical protein